jgi:nitroreductase
VRRPTRPATRASRRGRAGRAALAVALAVAVLVPALALVPVVTDPAWRTAWAEVPAPAPARALPDGPVMVLGGSPTRLPLALTLPGVPGPTRPLVLSASAIDDWRARGGSCTDAHIVCVMPDPASTYGESLALDTLARERGWDAVTVVTSDFHVARTRWQMAACTDVTTVVVAPGAGPSADDDPRLERLKLLNAGLRTACRSTGAPR